MGPCWGVGRAVTIEGKLSIGSEACGPRNYALEGASGGTGRWWGVILDLQGAEGQQDRSGGAAFPLILFDAG